MASLDNLPEDILCDIASKLSIDDNMRLRLVCRVLSMVAAQFALKNLYVRLSVHPLSVRREKLRAFGLRMTEGVRWVRVLTISCLSLGKISGSATQNVEKEHIVGDELKSDLEAALAQINLHTLRWLISSSDYNWSFEVIPRHLATHPVRNVVLDFKLGFPNDKEMLVHNLGKINHLQQLTIHDVCRTASPFNYDDFMIHEMANIIERSPALTHLTISSGWSTFWSPPPNLRQFLKANPNPQISTMCLDSLGITLDDITTPYFRSLHSLYLRYSNSGEQAGIWNSLRSEEIKLRRIETDIDEVSEELLDYLEYCSGVLIDLAFHKEEAIHRETPARVNAATIFYSRTLPQLADELQYLSVHTITANKWCYDRSNAKSIKQCKKLRMLEVSIVDLDQDYSLPLLNLLHESVAHRTIPPEIKTFNVHRVPQIG
ncbi:hypothetical protein BDN70DRAFT_886970 [Pholiota conissans]|uniref:F-box domain-containing protein n=1 Tax=Pholiota conissans TaxID=109636 RepID=A0A9P6CTU2_9AGAR|nr:hypothetical protein BDN70DRAFT_886970 [Pholiota conissans]